MHFAIVHDFEAEPAEFWRVFFHPPYNDALYDRIGVKEWARLRFEEDEATIQFAVRVLPRRDLPGVIKKVVGGDLGYTEISTYYKGKDRIDVRIEPTLLRERTKITASYTVAPTGPGRLRRTYEGDIHVDFPLVGRKIEAAIVEDLRRSFDVAAEVTREWLKRGP
jgi:hypothetical protein